MITLQNFVDLLKDNNNTISIGDKFIASINENSNDIDFFVNTGDSKKLIAWTTLENMEGDLSNSQTDLISAFVNSFIEPENDPSAQEIKKLQDIVSTNELVIEQLQKDVAHYRNKSQESDRKNGMIEAYERILMRPTTIGN